MMTIVKERFKESMASTRTYTNANVAVMVITYCTAQNDKMKTALSERLTASPPEVPKGYLLRGQTLKSKIVIRLVKVISGEEADHVVIMTG